jgi:prevent-host-death family protein
MRASGVLLCFVGTYGTFRAVKGAAAMITTITSREFNQDSGKAKRAADAGPVFITDRGKPAHVLLTIDEYRRLTAPRLSIGQMLFMPGAEDIELDIPARSERAKLIDLD